MVQRTLTLLALALIAATASALADQNGSVSGYVHRTDGATMTRTHHYTIALCANDGGECRFTQTNAQGFYAFLGVAPARYAVFAVPSFVDPRFTPAPTICVMSGDTFRVDLSISGHPSSDKATIRKEPSSTYSLGFCN